MKYKQILVNDFMSNNQLEGLDDNYELVAAINTKEGIVYTFKQRGFFSRLFNKLF